MIFLFVILPLVEKISFSVFHSMKGKSKLDCYNKIKKKKKKKKTFLFLFCFNFTKFSATDAHFCIYHHQYRKSWKENG